MRNALASFAVLAGAAAAFGNVSFGVPMFPGSYSVEMDGPPPYSFALTVDEGPPKTVSDGVTVSTWDLETRTYRAPSPTGDNYSFSPPRDVFLEDYPPYPLQGPPVLRHGTYKRN